MVVTAEGLPAVRGATARGITVRGITVRPTADGVVCLVTTVPRRSAPLVIAGRLVIRLLMPRVLRIAGL